MTHTEIDALVKSFLVDTATGPVNPRVQQVTVRLVSDLFKAIEDLDLQPSEIWKGLEYLAEAGATHELGLLAPGIGLERFIDIRADEADAKAGLAGATPRTIEGPLYVAGAPAAEGFARLDDGTEADQGEVLFMQGTVYDTHGKPLPGAKVEVWHANLMGNYSFFDKSQSAFNLRRTIVTDANGRYQFRSIVPMGYACLPAERHHAAPAGPARPPWQPPGAHPLLRLRARPPQADHADQHRRRRIPVGRLRLCQP